MTIATPPPPSTQTFERLVHPWHLLCGEIAGQCGLTGGIKSLRRRLQEFKFTPFPVNYLFPAIKDTNLSASFFSPHACLLPWLPDIMDFYGQISSSISKLAWSLAMELYHHRRVTNTRSHRKLIAFAFAHALPAAWNNSPECLHLSSSMPFSRNYL